MTGLLDPAISRIKSYNICLYYLPADISTNVKMMIGNNGTNVSILDSLHSFSQ